MALNAIFIKSVLPILDNDKWKLTAYNNMNAALLFVPVGQDVGLFINLFSRSISLPDLSSLFFFASSSADLSAF